MKRIEGENIEFYPAWQTSSLAEPEYVYVDRNGSFVYDIRQAMSFGNMRLASLLADFRNPSPESDRKFVVLQRVETFNVQHVAVPEYYKRKVE